MAMQIHNGLVYDCCLVREGENASGKWILARIKGDKGRDDVTIFIANVYDCGIHEDDAGCKIKVVDWGVNSDNEKDGGTYGRKEFPKGSGKWVQNLCFNGVIAYKVEEAPKHKKLSTNPDDLPF